MGNKKRIDGMIEEMRAKGNLPALDETVLDITRLLKEENTNPSDLTAVIMRDCGLTSNLLVTVNSAFYAPALPIKTISSAVTYLGLHKVYSLVLGFAIFRNSVEFIKKRNLLKLYASSYFSGSLCMTLAKDLEKENPEEIFIAGLLYQLPKMALASTYPDQFNEMRNLIHNELISNNQACLKVFKVSYDELCTAIIKLYNLPGKVSSVLKRDTMEEDPVTILVKGATHIAGMLFGNAKGGKKAIRKIEDELKEVLKNKKFRVSDCIMKTYESDDNIRQFFNLNHDDVEMMVNLLEWGKAIPIDVVSKIAFGNSDEVMEEKKESPETLIGHFLTELSILRRKSGDINQILMMAQEAIYRCISNSSVFIAFIDALQKALIGRFYAGDSSDIKAGDFEVSLKSNRSVFVQAILEKKSILWTGTDSHLPLPALIIQHTPIHCAYLIPIIVRHSPIGLCFIARTDSKGFSEREVAWIDQIVEHIEISFNNRART